MFLLIESITINYESIKNKEIVPGVAVIAGVETRVETTGQLRVPLWSRTRYTLTASHAHSVSLIYQYRTDELPYKFCTSRVMYIFCSTQYKNAHKSLKTFTYNYSGARFYSNEGMSTILRRVNSADS